MPALYRQHLFVPLPIRLHVSKKVPPFLVQIHFVVQRMFDLAMLGRILPILLQSQQIVVVQVLVVVVLVIVSLAAVHFVWLRLLLPLLLQLLLPNFLIRNKAAIL